MLPMRGNDWMGRLGGDEFAVLLLGSDALGATALATAAVNELRDPIVLSAFHTVATSCSIGIAQSEPGDTASAVLRNADFAMLWVVATLLLVGLVMVYSAIRPGPDIQPILQAVEKPAED